MKNAASGYRWVVLGVFALVNLTIQALWIGYAPIAALAASYYGVTDLAVGMFAMSFMIAFLPLSIPSSWAIDKFGFRHAVGIGSAMMGVFGILRGLAGRNYALAMLCTVGIAATQPLLLNSWTTVPAKWFPAGQRATAVGVVTLGSLIGTALGMVLTPVLVEAGFGIDRVQLIYGIAAAASALLFILLSRERPAVPPSEDATRARALVLDGMKIALSSRRFWLSLAISFIGLGVFNGLTTWIEGILRPRGFGPTFAGSIGALMLAGGLAGAIVMPALSDKTGKRRLFIVIAFAGTVPGILGLAFAPSALLIAASAAWIGFFLVSALPIAMQYAAEVTRPAPEGTSNGLIQLTGQGAVVFVYFMEALKGRDGSFTLSLLIAAGLLIVGVALMTGMEDARS
jgi:MFS family permease